MTTEEQKHTKECREAFEDACERDDVKFSIQRDIENGGYLFSSTRSAWVLWQQAWNAGTESGLVSGKQPIETAPKGIPVLVAGGIAMQKTGGEWFTGMEEPRYELQLQWQPKWWMPIPAENDAPKPTCQEPKTPEREAIIGELVEMNFEPEQPEITFQVPKDSHWFAGSYKIIAMDGQAPKAGPL